MTNDYRETDKELPRDGAHIAWPWNSGEMRGRFIDGRFVFAEMFVGTPLVLFPKRWRYLKPDEL